MKKTAFYAFMMAAVVGTSFTACHDSDDDDGEDSYVASFYSPKISESVFTKLTKYANLYSYILQDGGSGYVDVWHYNMLPPDEIIASGFDTTGVALDHSYMKDLFGNSQGGFCPAWTSADDTNSDNAPYYLPISGTYHNESGSNALICNSGMICKALFSKHLSGDFDALLAAMSVGKLQKLYVQPNACYKALIDSENFGYEVNVTPLPANHKIVFRIYGYVDSFNASSFKKAINTIKDAGKSVSNGGKLGGEIVLAEADANGKVTVNTEWQEMDMSALEKYYLYEAYVTVVDGNGKDSDTYTIENNADLGYVWVDDLTFESANLLSKLVSLF
ncbi:MAG: hypothetical protein K6G73_02640 [Marinilabiliaceae bacterium]|nr:hypothetical protein [Marinilabiliaceae bacterium]